MSTVQLHWPIKTFRTPTPESNATVFPLEPMIQLAVAFPFRRCIQITFLIVLPPTLHPNQESHEGVHEFCIIYFFAPPFSKFNPWFIYILLQDLSPLEDPRYSSNDYCSSGLLRECGDHLRNRIFAILSTEHNQIGKYPNIFCFRMTTFCGRHAKTLEQ